LLLEAIAAPEAESENSIVRPVLITVAVAALAAAADARAQDASAAGREAAHEAVRAALLERATLPPPRPPDPGAEAAAEQVRVREREERAAHERATSHVRRHAGEVRHGDGANTAGGAPQGDGAAGRGADGCADGHDAARQERTRGMHEGEQPHDGGPHR
jgi:hypothetical protein